MIFSFKKTKLLLLLCGIYSSTQAGILDFVGMHCSYGSTVAMDIEKSAKTMIENGSLYALSKILIQADTFKGTGYMDAPTVVINTKNFDFSGTIRCYNDCIINAEKFFNKKIFKREGPGKFIINIGAQAINKQKEKALLTYFSMEPLKNAMEHFKNEIFKFPEQHPIQTAVILGGSVALCAYLIHDINRSEPARN